MRRFSILALTLASLAFVGTTVHAQVFYEYPGVPVVKENEPVFGPCIGLGDDLFRINGFARFNVSTLMDFGLELVFDNANDTWRYGAGGDVKYAIVPENTTMPFDLSLNAGFGFESGGDVKSIIVPLGGLVSRPLQLASGRVFAPYGGVYLLILHTSIDLPADVADEVDSSDTDTDVELRGGVRLEMNAQADLFAALHLGAGTMFYIGLNWRL